MLKEFREFVARGNVLDLAVGVIMGAAFGRIVTTLVEGVIMPPIGLLLGRTDFSGLFLVVDSTKGIPMSLADAKTQGIPVIAYGQFINDIVSFLIVALAVFLLASLIPGGAGTAPIRGSGTPADRSSAARSAGYASSSRPGFSASSHRATTSLRAPNQAMLVIRVSIGGHAPEATASSR